MTGIPPYPKKRLVPGDYVRPGRYPRKLPPRSDQLGVVIDVEDYDDGRPGYWATVKWPYLPDVVTERPRYLVYVHPLMALAAQAIDDGSTDGSTDDHDQEGYGSIPEVVDT